MQTWTFEHGALSFRVPESWRRPHGPSVRMLRVATQLAMRGALRTYIRLDAVGRENLPLDRSFVMVCNHSSHLDAVCLLSTLPLTRIHTAFPVAAADYFFSTSLRSILSTVAVNGLPLDRQNGTDGLRVCRQLLTDSKTVLIIFPEGTRTCTGTLGRFRSGVARLVAGTDVPVVPCYLSGAFEVWPKGQILPRPGALRLTIGRPQTFKDVSPHDRVAIASTCSLLRDAVVSLFPS
ncbi:MAG TPA: lysophospholipid acyltransferase family protein [Vicinamibacterales bacterium]|jgi:1-acyl-sn-glycerol-3-phosphate acyltransferase|nr:lysophospholipid acyltransferase family protein [Vicinamibacterales bacterium]